MRTRVRGWRWRHNPLRRRSDVIEAWTALIAATLLLVAAPLVGVLAGWWAHDQARGVAVTQRAERHPVRAEVTGEAPDQLPTVQGGRQHTYRVQVRWTDPATGTHTTTARVPAGTRHGDKVSLWFDAKGHNVPPPPGSTAIWQHTVTVGAIAAGGAVAVVLLVNVVVRHISAGHRLAEWERAWARTEPEWTRRRA
ncbi:DUF3592 domain-containing protein [Streptomyces sp. NPDC048419]|uniref:Rv1733c family protein n=1 Tax=Streptomyces sp. NPDC048419 TaxID=3365547 RepID=UPI0037197388